MSYACKSTIPQCVGPLWSQCDQKKFAKCLKKLPKNDFTSKMID